MARRHGNPFLSRVCLVRCGLANVDVTLGMGKTGYTYTITFSLKFLKKRHRIQITQPTILHCISKSEISLMTYVLFRSGELSKRRLLRQIASRPIDEIAIDPWLFCNVQLYCSRVACTRLIRDCLTIRKWHPRGARCEARPSRMHPAIPPLNGSVGRTVSYVFGSALSV